MQALFAVLCSQYPVWMPLSTLTASAEHLLEVKHSRFLARATPVNTPNEALTWLDRVRIVDATHNCWAWRMGQDYRSSDDGEPSGTAGRPILAAIDGQACDQVVVMVTRWFGGIKLGAGGLVRAYGRAAAECLRLAEKRALIAMTQVDIQVPFAELGTVHALFSQHQAHKCEERFDAIGAWMRLELPASELAALRTHLRDATRNQVQINDNNRNEYT